MDRGAWQATVHGVVKVRHDLVTKPPSGNHHPPVKEILFWGILPLEFVLFSPLNITHTSVFAWRIPMEREAWRATVHEVAKSQKQLSHQAQHSTLLIEDSLLSFSDKYLFSDSKITLNNLALTLG